MSGEIKNPAGEAGRDRSYLRGTDQTMSKPVFVMALKKPESS
jgi:hypothetical protein